MQGKRGLSRRAMLGVMGGASAAAASAGLVGCSSGGSKKLVMTTVTEKGQIDSDAFYKKWLATFTERTGIDVELRTYPFDQYANSVQLLFSQGSPPDVFRSAGTDIAQPVPFVRGWEHPMNDYVTDEWKATWPDGSLDPKISGLHIGDELYAAPFAANGSCRELYCNIELLNKYGISEPPKTWGEFEDAANKITKDSNKKVHGFYPLTGAAFSVLQASSGPDITGLGPTAISLKTGKPSTSDPGQVAMIEMMQRMNASGAFLPGWETKQAQQSDQMWSAFAQNKVAMSIGYNWNYREMLRLRKDLPLVMADAPVPDDGRKGYTGQAYVFLPFWHMGSKTKKPDDAWKLIAFLSSPEVMLAYYKIARRNPPALPKDKFGDMLDKWDDRMFEIQKETVKLGPVPSMHTIDAASVKGQINQAQPQPVFGDMELLAVTRGKAKFDYASKAADFDAKYAKAMDKELETAKGKGLKVDHDTFVFSDWDPLKEYTPQGVKIPEWH